MVDPVTPDSSHRDTERQLARAHALLAECAAVLKVSRRGWLQADLLNDVWGYLRANKVPIPGDPERQGASSEEDPR